jgi:hydroxyacylglutathione hydrolase
MQMHVQIFTFNPFQENTYLLYDDSKECVIIDPGCYERSEVEVLHEFIVSKSLDVKLILNTHCHIDHILGNYALKQRYSVPLLIPEHEEEIFRSAKVYAANYGFPLYTEAEPDGYLNEKRRIAFGSQELAVLFVPGHSPGHLALYQAQQKILISGDVLFRETVGRVDFPGGSMDILLESIHQKLFTLPDEAVVYPGHGPTTTIGHEKQFNPFCGIRNS